MKVLLVASDKAELKPFPDSYIKAVSGIGPVLSAAITASSIHEYKPDIVISVGSAGSAGRLKLGECVSFGRVISPDPDLTAFHLGRGSTILPTRATINGFVLDRNSEYILSSSSAFATVPFSSSDASDMEAYGVAAAAYLQNIPCFAVKVITDIIGKRISMGDYGFNLRKLRDALLPEVERVISSL